jgi:hypothetical protein
VNERDRTTAVVAAYLALKALALALLLAAPAERSAGSWM